MYAEQSVILYESQTVKEPLQILKVVWDYDQDIAVLLLSIIEEERTILDSRSTNINLAFVHRIVHKGNHLVLTWDDAGVCRDLYLSSEFCTLDFLNIKVYPSSYETPTYKEFKLINPTSLEINFFTFFLGQNKFEDAYSHRFGLTLKERCQKCQQKMRI